MFGKKQKKEEEEVGDADDEESDDGEGDEEVPSPSDKKQPVQHQLTKEEVSDLMDAHLSRYLQLLQIFKRM